MATAQTATTAAKTAKKTAAPAAGNAELLKKRALRRRKKTEGRKKLTAKLKTDKEFSKAFFEGRSKRANDKKAAFRKKKSKKK
jgi:hypothetical protein